MLTIAQHNDPHLDLTRRESTKWWHGELDHETSALRQVSDRVHEAGNLFRLGAQVGDRVPRLGFRAIDPRLKSIRWVRR